MHVHNLKRRPEIEIRVVYITYARVFDYCKLLDNVPVHSLDSTTALCQKSKSRISIASTKMFKVAESRYNRKLRGHGNS